MIMIICEECFIFIELILIVFLFDFKVCFFYVWLLISNRIWETCCYYVYVCVFGDCLSDCWKLIFLLILYKFEFVL